MLSVLPGRPFVFKTDVQRYYASIDQVILMEQLAAQVREPIIRRLVWQAIRRTTWGGWGQVLHYSIQIEWRIHRPLSLMDC